VDDQACPLFSVVVPVFNRRGLLSQTLQSVLEQRATDFEVVVVDDGSTDGSADVARSFGGKVRVVEGPNGGAGAARNCGAQVSRGRYLAFLDSDDLWFPWTLESYGQVVRADDAPAFIAGKPRLFHDDAPPVHSRDEGLAFVNYRDYYASGDEWRWWGASSFVVERTAFMAVGGFACDRMNSEDADLAMRLGVARGFVQVKSPDTFGYRVHGASLTSNMDQTVVGALHMVEAEHAGRYPGGAERAGERRRILGRHLRPVIADCFREGRQQDGWRLYQQTLRWHLQAGRWRFLLGAPLQSVSRSRHS
jgi:GT2 family glycosyltransferase